MVLNIRKNAELTLPQFCYFYQKDKMSRFSTIIIFLLFSACQPKGQETTIILSVFNGDSSYINWASKNNSNLNIVEGISCKNIDSLLATSSGIILTGGEDINPAFYNKKEYLSVCGRINHQRDSIEKIIFDYALNKHIPLLGICRGMQMTNVLLGGTLIPDIPSFIDTTIKHREGGITSHLVFIEQTSDLIFPSNRDTFLVNSNHHQCIDSLANGLQIIARSFDNVPEAVVYDSLLHPYYNRSTISSRKNG